MVNDVEPSKKTEGAPDTNSPLYIHASDYPKQMHVHDTLTDNNYADWSQEMMNFLFAKNKVGFIDGSIQKRGKNSHDYMLWMQCDSTVKVWLTTMMEKDIRVSEVRQYSFRDMVRSTWKVWNRNYPPSLRVEIDTYYESSKWIFFINILHYELKQTLTTTH